MAKNYGAIRGLSRFEGFTDAVFAIALTLLIVEIKPPGAPDGPQGYESLVHAMAEQWREYLALLLCYVTIGAYWLQHHYTGRIYARSDHVFGVLNLLFLLAIIVVPYPIRVWSFHLGTPFEPMAAVTLTVALAFTAVAWMMKWFYGMSGGRRVMDERLAPDFLKQMTRRYGIATVIQIAAVPVAVAWPRVGAGIALLTVAWFFIPQPSPRYQPGREPDREEKEEA
ncbi:MAG TPA: TMEM175 family protein [Allosphingosinicella sp.]|nr:TMEM175 family protein [Allosphingosinicella sp.]